MIVLYTHIWVVEERNNERPILSDLRQLGKIEENVGVVLMVYKESSWSDRNN